MNGNTRRLHEPGQSLWIDNISRDMLADGTLARYIDEYSVTGLTSNPTIFEKAIGAGSSYDAQIAELARGGRRRAAARPRARPSRRRLRSPRGSA